MEAISRLVEPELVVEVGSDVAQAAGGWRHPARRHRARSDHSPADLPRRLTPR
ncbi:ATP-dependent DNA ligase [Streptomyces griseoluteus]|uniref:ATP-dependent DNA ligase n=1 Tax=Streptomyces griseoluteus TaxID=29306 RepID=UPI0033FE007A